MGRVIDRQAKKIVLALEEGINSAGEVVDANRGMKIGLRTDIIRGLVPGGCYGKVGGERIVACLVEVIERSDFELSFRREGVNPVEDDKGIALALRITQTSGVVVVRCLFPVIGIGIVWNLEVVVSELCIEPELVLRSLIAQQGSESALGIGGVVMN